MGWFDQKVDSETASKARAGVAEAAARRRADREEQKRRAAEAAAMAKRGRQ